MSTRLLLMLWLIVSVFQGAAWGQTFTLTGSTFLPVTSHYTQGDLSGNSSVDVQSGGSVDQLSAYDSSSVTLSGDVQFGDSVGQLSASDNSSVTLSGGSVGQLLVRDNSGITLSGGSVGDITAYNSTDVHLSDGSAESFSAYDFSTVNVSGGTVTNSLGGYGDSEIELTGGQITALDAGGESLITFYGSDWSVTGPLSFVGGEVFGTGTGILSGRWPDGTDWSTKIWKGDTATIRLASTPNPCGECKGKVSQLTLRYTGTIAQVRVEQKGKKGKRDRKAERGEKREKGEKKGKDEKRKRHEKGERGEKGRDVSNGVVVFEGQLAEGGEPFTFVGLDDNGTLGTEISLFINGELDTQIHTSCSKPIYPGMISGLFEVVEGYSLEGGLICPLDTEPPDHGCK